MLFSDICAGKDVTSNAKVDPIPSGAPPELVKLRPYLVIPRLPASWRRKSAAVSQFPKSKAAYPPPLVTSAARPWRSEIDSGGWDMPYNELIEARVQKIISSWENTDHKNMFGGICHPDDDSTSWLNQAKEFVSSLPPK